MKNPKKSIALRLNYAYKNLDGKYQILMECRNFNTKPDPLRISVFDSSGKIFKFAKSNVHKGKITGIPKASKYNAYFEKLEYRIFLVMDYLTFNRIPKSKKNVEHHLYKNLSEVYNYFQNIDITDPEEVVKYSEGLRKTPAEWKAEHEESVKLEKELGIFKPVNLIEAIDFYKFPSVDSTVKTILKSYAKSLGHQDLSIAMLNKKLLEDCVKHAKTMETNYKRGYMLSTLKKFVKKMRSLATCLKSEGFNIDSSVHDYRLKAGKHKSQVAFNYTEKQNVWALKRDEYLMVKNLKITDKTLIKVRDMFVVETEAGGLRVNELFAINEDSIQNLNGEHELILIAGKSTKILQYTIKEETYQLIKKYKFNMQQFAHGQTYNILLRKLAEKAGLKREVVQIYGDISTNTIITKKFPIYKLFSSKAARKAFISILYNDNVPIDKIARITRHSTEAINHYISVLENVDRETIKRF